MKMKNKILALLLALCLIMGIVGCGAQSEPETEAPSEEQTEEQTPVEPEVPEEPEQEAEPEQPKPVILVVSFGTSYNDSRDITIGAVETALQNAYPDYEVRRAFTSQIIIDILKDRDNLEIDNVTEAMDRLVADGVKEVVIQPTHVMPGFEYDDVMKEIAPYADKFDSMMISDPLLYDDKDFDRIVQILAEETKVYNEEGTAVVFMGHGTEHEANATYARLQKRLTAAGYNNYFVGTVEATPSLDDVLAAVQATDATKVVLEPLMIVAGDHANNDMAGDEEGSWKTAFTNAGYEVECVLRGLGEFAGVQQMYIEKTARAMEGEKPVLLTVSFGTSYNSSRDITIGAVENALQAAYPEYEVRRAFTSQIIIDILEERDGHEIDNVTEAMERLVADGVKEVIVQPTHVMEGFEYDDVVKEITPYKSQFDSLKIGSGMLITDEDYAALIDILTKETEMYNQEGTAIVFMGHGTEHASNATYATLQQKITEAGYNNYFIGTVEATPSLDDVLAAVQASGATRVVLEPLMIVAGDHANNDMAGDEEDSWKTAFANAGFEVECVLRGLGEFEGVQQLIVKHAGEARELPDAITADKLMDGTYSIAVESSSSMFNIVECELTVKEGAMSAKMTMSGKGYGKVFMGTGEEAQAAAEEDYIQNVPAESGVNTFTVPVEALDADLDCAAWSIKKEKWYDRTLVFQSDLLPDEAFAD